MAGGLKINKLGVMLALSLIPLYGYAEGGAQPMPAPSEQQNTAAPTTAPASAAVFSKEEIEQMVAPIALYPDPLVAQILMASTYPLEIVTAARWSAQNPALQGKALEDALQSQPWDPSVKSLVAVPKVLDALNKNIDKTEKLGNAFLAQQQDVVDAIQVLRARAEKSGNLKSTKEQTVKTVQQKSTDYTPATAPAYNPDYNTPVIEIEPTDPELLYVPVYDPAVVYGTWPYSMFPPYSYYPAGYFAAGAFTFASGIAIGNALWGHCNWHNGNIGINVNEFNQFNRTNINNNHWEHNPAHRDGVPYRGEAVQQRYGDRNRAQQLESRENFRNQMEHGNNLLDAGKGAAAGALGGAAGAAAGAAAANRNRDNRDNNRNRDNRSRDNRNRDNARDNRGNRSQAGNRQQNRQHQGDRRNNQQRHSPQNRQQRQHGNAQRRPQGGGNMHRGGAGRPSGGFNRGGGRPSGGFNRSGGRPSGGFHGGGGRAHGGGGGMRRRR